MEIQKILEIISQGENSSIEFKSSKVRPESIAKEMAAFSNRTATKEELSRLFSRQE